MRLRTQLSLVSLLIFVLPWTGYYYVNDMAFALRVGAMQSLKAQANALAQRIESDPVLLQSLQLSKEGLPAHNVAHHQAGRYTYVPMVPYRPAVDGYADHPAEQPQPYDQRDDDVESLQGDTAAQTQLHLSQSNGYLHGFLQVVDADIQYFNPHQRRRKSGDYLRFTIDGKDLLLRTSSSGMMQVVDADTGKARVGISAYWLESVSGYDVEFSLPWPRNSALALQVFDNGKLAWQFESPIISQLPALNRVIGVFSQDGQQVSVVIEGGWLVAQQRKPDVAVQHETHGLLLWVYKRLLRLDQFQQMPDPQPDVRLHLNQADHGQWYRQGGELVAVYQQPIYGTPVRTWVRIQQSSNDLVALTSYAFSRLFLYSLLSIAIVFALLVLYASWLSYRIRILSQAASHAVDDEGQLRSQLPMLRSKDELGDLARSFSALLSQVQSYNDYLRSLADKLSHELRTPIAVMRGSLDNLQALNQQADLAVYVDRAAEAGQRLTTMLNAMGAAQRLEDSLQTATIEDVPLHEVLQQLHVAYQQAYPIANIEVSTEAVNLRIADELIVQMLDKLIDNAVSFCPTEGRIHIGLQCIDQQAVLSVANDGPLLPDGMEQQMFNSLVSKREQRHEQVHLGLGLYIVKLIADFHQADVSAANRDDGSGVVFTVRFSQHR